MLTDTESPTRIDPEDLASISIPSMRRATDGKLLWDKPGGEIEELDEFPRLLQLGHMVFEFQEEDDRIGGPFTDEDDRRPTVGYYTYSYCD